MPSATTPFSNNVLSISSLNRLVRDCLETAFPLMWIEGEISNLTYAASGHVYFSLKDERAQARCVMWRSRAQTLGWRLANGQKVEVRALVSFYEPRGEFQLSVEAIRRAGQGNLFERFLRLKAQLESEGLFAAETKRTLPGFPRRIGIVTSLQAAALRDVLSTLQRRAPHLDVTIFPTLVQGDGAAQNIANAVRDAGQSGCDAIILCRGGGSIEDLWAFNEEIVARAIRACPVPVVAGIGHETDFTIADFAADLRAPTPTAAAELVSPDREALLASLDQLEGQLQRAAKRTLADRQQRLDLLSIRLIHPAERLRQRQADITTLARRLSLAIATRQERRALQFSAIAQRLDHARPQPGKLSDRLAQLRDRLAQQAEWQLTQRAAKLAAYQRSLTQLDPHAVLSRGYALAIGPDGRAVRDAASLTRGDSLRIGFARGLATATVDQVVAVSEAE